MSDPNILRGNFYDVKYIDVRLARLNPDSAESCPVPTKDIIEYIGVETSGFEEHQETQKSMMLRFARTAVVGKTKFWIWEFEDGPGEACYAHVELWPDGTTIINCDDTFDMTVDQFILATYFRIEP